MSTAFLPALGDDLARIAAALRESLVVLQSRQGAGTGLVWAPGLVATSNHVVPGERTHVSRPDGAELEGRAVARDESFDVALLEVETGGMPVATAAATVPTAGEVVIAVGHPWGERGYVTAGVLLGIEAGRDAKPGYLKADLRLAPGNSGGPLANARGEVVGVNGMIAGGLGVATSVYRVKQLASAIGHAAEPGRLGIEVAPVTAPGDRPGLIVTGIDPEGAGWRGGLLPGDVIVDVEGYAGHMEIANRLGRIEAGKPLPLTVVRGGAQVSLAPTPMAQAA